MTPTSMDLGMDEEVGNGNGKIHVSYGKGNDSPRKLRPEETWVHEKMTAACFSFAALVFTITILAVVANIDIRPIARADLGFITEQIYELKELVVNETCPGAQLVSPHQPVPASGLEWTAFAYDNMGNKDMVPMAERRYEGLAAQLKPIGWHQDLLPEASDAVGRPELVADGKSGDTDFPHGDFQTIITIGEYDRTTGYLPVGVPDGQGVYLKDMDTVRLVFQAESYGHISGNPSWYLPVNDGKAKFTGSHISYVDYDKASFKAALANKSAIVSTVKGAGELFDSVYNLAGNPVDGTAANPHYGDTGVNGEFVSKSPRYENEWTFHSFCSAHLEEAFQWGPDIGMTDSSFITVEEWTTLDPVAVAANGFVGLSAHAVDMNTKQMFAIGAFGMGGYEKIIEFSCGVAGYICYSLSGYNGNFGDKTLLTQKNAAGKRSDGSDWVWPQDIVPARVYVGIKGYNADGSACGDACGYLARNGMAYGKVYGFTVPAATPNRDDWHKNNDRAQSPEAVSGKFESTAWQWDGVVKDFTTDQSWDFQEPPPNNPAYKFWTAKGRDASGSKTEHNSPHPGGEQSFIQGSTAGYMGIYSLPTLTSTLQGLAGNALPASIDGAYELVEGETDITTQIELGGKGVRADGGNQKKMCDGHSGSGACTSDKSTFEDIDGLEWFIASDGHYVLVQEDGGNRFGERTFFFKLPPKGVKPTYYFLAQSGGHLSTRMLAGVSIPPLTHSAPTAHEFSGSSDFSGTFIQTSLGGYARRQAEATVAFNDKYFCMGLQAHTIRAGVVKAFGTDRGGQIFAFKPNITFSQSD